MTTKYDFSAWRVDATESALFSRSLEHVRAQALEVNYPELQGRSLVPVDNSINNGAETGLYRVYDKVGTAEITSDYSTRGPRADVTGKEVTYKFRGVKSSYGYSLQEMRASVYAGAQLPARKANAARYAIEQAIDEQIFVGSVLGGFKGLTNQANTVTETAAGVWSSATSDAILTDMNKAVKKIVVDSNGVEIPDTMLLPLDQYSIIADKARATGTDTSVLKYFLGTNPYIKRVIPVVRLATASSGSPMAIIYKLDPNKLQAPIPQEFEQLPPQIDGYETVTQCHARVGGVVLYYPKSMCYLTGL